MAFRIDLSECFMVKLSVYVKHVHILNFGHDFFCRLLCELKSGRYYLLLLALYHIFDFQHFKHPFHLVPRENITHFFTQDLI